MKKFSFVLAAAAMMLAACQPEEEKIPVVDVTMSSFGFYAETNPEALKADFVVAEPSSQISIVLPYGTPEDALKMKELTNCDGIMIARGSQGNPWLFRQIKDVLEGRTPKEVSNKERVEMCIRHY